MNTISILELSLSGGLLILAVILLRALALDRLPKGTFLALWLVAAVRLLVPVSIPSPLSVYSLVRRAPENVAAMEPAPAVPVLPVLTGTEAVPGAPAVPLWETVWLAGALVCGGFFLLSYLRCRREYRTALPVGEELRGAFLSSVEGTVQEVLFEEGGAEGQVGYTPNYTPVTVRELSPLQGRILPVRLAGREGDGCGGCLV